ncbi:Na+/H+ antiporter [Actinokineospora guangxiensis]|uniref:Na+/H+ antiporter n=1 Tax=Actinokineospora guangxiensis TaxID=1490288 RepID=A0ABW0EP42_9PSEU
METLLVGLGLMLGAVVLVGVGDRLRLPWPALMVLLGGAVALVPLPHGVHVDPELILPLFLPPLLYATAQRTSWALFRARWRAILAFAVALVVATVAATAAAAYLLIPGITLTAAVALGAMVSPPDPVAVESVAGRVKIPRRMLSVLQSEGLFNDAAALVIFQVAIAATVAGEDLEFGGLLLRFVAGAAAAVLIGLGVAWVGGRVLARFTDTTGRSALTLVLPFAVYVFAEEVGASGVVAVVVLALQLRSRSEADAAAERLVQRSFWDVVELLVTGVAFGLVGLEIRTVVAEAGPALGGMLADAAVVCAVVVAVRVLWMLLAWRGLRRRGDPDAAPRTGREVVVFSWCGMRGLATLALALSLPATTASGAPFPARAELTVIACSVLVVTLLFAGLTLPTLVKLVGVADECDAEEAAERVVAVRAKKAAMRTVAQHDLPEEMAAVVRERLGRLAAVLQGEPESAEDRDRLAALRQGREVVRDVQAAALAAARAEVLAARREPGVDPEAADRVLRRLDLRTVLLE